MDIIPVTDDMSIELDTDAWRLVQKVQGSIMLRPLAEYTGYGLRFAPQFAGLQHLGRDKISVDDVERVTLGWEPRSNTWQLGLLLRHPAQHHNHRELEWCPLAAWQEGQQSAARRAGEGLARLLNRPFQAIEGHQSAVRNAEPVESTQPSQQTSQVMMQRVHLRPLPLELNEWSFHAAPQGMVVRHTSRWVLEHLGRSIFFALGAVVYIVLALGSVTAGLAEVSPHWLPLMALVVAALLLFSAGENLWKVLLRWQVVVDEANQELRRERSLTGFMDWRIPFDQIEYLLVSQKPARSQGRRSNDDPMRIVQEAWLHCFANGSFYLIGEIGKVEGRSWNWENVRQWPEEGPQQRLSLNDFDTPLHHAAQWIGNKLHIPVYIDIR